MGFSATEAIQIMSVLVSEYERRQFAYLNLLWKILEGRTTKQIIKNYRKLVPDAKETAEEILACLPKNAPREYTAAWVATRWDAGYMNAATFRTHEIVALCSYDADKVERALNAISLVPGSLVDVDPSSFFLDNPVWDRPVIRLADGYICPIPQMAFSHIHRIMDRLAEEAGLKQQLADRRSSYLEKEIETVFRAAFPSADVKSGVKWSKDGQQFETDLVVAIDQIIIIVEAKSHRLTPRGMSGVPGELKRHITDLVLKPSIQSTRLKDMIENARLGNANAKAALAAAGLNTDNASHIIRLSVSLADLSVLSASEADFKKAGWVPDDQDIAPTIAITDLKCAIDILENELLFLHYLTERGHLQKAVNLMGDELDFLGLYLLTGFNLAAALGEADRFSPTGLSSTIDTYYQGIEAGLKLRKPAAALRPLFRDIVDRLVETKNPAWTLAGIHLLSCADPAEQIAIERNLIQLRSSVRKQYRDIDHANTVEMVPPLEREASVMFHLFPAELGASHRDVMQALAADVLTEGRSNAAVVFSRCIDRWERPYESVLVVENDPTGIIAEAAPPASDHKAAHP